MYKKTKEVAKVFSLRLQNLFYKFLLKKQSTTGVSHPDFWSILLSDNMQCPG